MSEIRKDPASPTWVIIATERGKRPWDFQTKRAPTVSENRCDLCQEMRLGPAESETWPGELDEQGRWLTRVLINKYPALSPEATLEQFSFSDLYHELSGVGGAEVIVESPNHQDDLAHISSHQMEAVVRTYAGRYMDWHADSRIAYLLVFKNHGVEAGASLTHPHSQAIATPLIPSWITQELEEALDYHEREGECVYCRIIETEKQSDPNRIVLENGSMICLVPFAARFPAEMKILPKKHMSEFEDMDAGEVVDLAEIMTAMGKKLSKLLADPPFNYLIHVSPLKTPGLDYYHWHIEVIPRVAIPAGFEWGTGIYINSLAPEEAARGLRQAEL